jgi:hypothetical protein
MSYDALPDPVVGSDSFVKAVVTFKFCTFGFVSSNEWEAGFITVRDAILRLYDSRQSAEDNVER